MAKLAYDEGMLLDVASGIESYALQNGDDFPFANERGETKEIFFSVGRPTYLDMYWNFRGHLDIDEVEAWYFNGAILRDFELPADVFNTTSLSLGFIEGEQADWLYGFDPEGLADLTLRSEFTYPLDRATTVEASLNWVQIVDSEIKEWFDQIGIEHNNIFFTLGLRWGWGE